MTEPQHAAQMTRMVLDLTDDPAALAAIERAKQQMLLEFREFGNRTIGLWAILCATGLRDLLSNPVTAPVYIGVLEAALADMPYQLVERRPN